MSLFSKIKVFCKGIIDLPGLVEQNNKISDELRELRSKLDELSLRADFEWGPGNTEEFNSDDFYYAFEERYRGTPTLIKSRLSVYLPYIERIRHIRTERGFLDIGCGRGDWLEILKEQDITAHGIDINRRTIRETQTKGLDTQRAGLPDYLHSLPSNSLSGISAFHVIEHLPFPILMIMLKEAFRVLVPGGILILETPNPENFLVGACNFYMDPTHRNPILPEALSFMLSHSGFKERECLNVSLPDYPWKDEDIPEIPLLKILNRHMTKGQDYAFISFKSVEE